MTKLPEEYYLMHKDIPVCLMELSSEGSVFRVRRNEAAADHFPIGGQMNDMKFHEWWKARAVPKGGSADAPHARKVDLGYVRSATGFILDMAHDDPLLFSTSIIHVPWYNHSRKS